MLKVNFGPLLETVGQRESDQNNGQVRQFSEESVRRLAASSRTTFFRNLPSDLLAYLPICCLSPRDCDQWAAPGNKYLLRPNL